jgi:hypothetical protein
MGWKQLAVQPGAKAIAASVLFHGRTWEHRSPFRGGAGQTTTAYLVELSAMWQIE